MNETLATPFTLSRKGMMDPDRPLIPETNPDWFHRDPEFFEAREPVIVHDNVPEEVLARVWGIYQRARTPDYGPSMQMGDLVLLRNDGETTWWLILAIGVRRVTTPRWWRLGLSPPQRHAICWLNAHNGLRFQKDQRTFPPGCPSLVTIRALINKGVILHEENGDWWTVSVKNVYRAIQ